MVNVIHKPGARSIKQIELALESLKGKVGKVGWFEKSKYDDKAKTPVAYVATIQEYGDPARGIPARPFMRPTIENKQALWRKIAEQGSKNILEGKDTAQAVMERIGLRAAGDIRRTISQIWLPPLSPRTIAARLAKRKKKKITKGLTKPLIDTGIMLGTLTNTVEDE